MDIRILQLIDGARAARGLTVVIDVFRAFSLEAYLLAGGAEKILPVGDAALAYRLKAEHPEFLLAGERHGRILPGFDFGNSPSEASALDVKGKTVVHTTSAGTQGIANATEAEEILGGSLVNARATAEYIRRKNPREVSLVCMGLEAKEPTEEDTLCARYIESLLLERPFDVKSEIDALRHTSGAKFFDPAQSDVFPRDDFFFSTARDRFPFAMVLKKEGEIPAMRKVDVL